MGVSRKIVVGVAALALALPGAYVGAAFTTETESFSLGPLGLDYKAVGRNVTSTTGLSQTASQDLTFDLFNTGLGTLLGVEVTFLSNVGLGGSITVTIDDDAEYLFSTRGSSRLSVSSAKLNEVSDLRGLKVDCTAGDTINDCSKPVALPASGSGLSFDRTSPMDLMAGASFMGPGTFTITTRMESTIAPLVNNASTLVDNATMDGTFDSRWTGTVTVRYEYRARTTGVVPEPATLLLLLAGIGGVALLRRRPR